MLSQGIAHRSTPFDMALVRFFIARQTAISLISSGWVRSRLPYALWALDRCSTRAPAASDLLDPAHTRPLTACRLEDGSSHNYDASRAGEGDKEDAGAAPTCPLAAPRGRR